MEIAVSVEEGLNLLEKEEFDCAVSAGLLLEELFGNLILNSLLHSEGDKIRVRVEDRGEEVMVSVEDNGEGIPDEINEKVFERGFRRGGASGSGLGLFLVKEIAESYGGNVEVKDSEMGGSRIDVCLKRA